MTFPSDRTIVASIRASVFIIALADNRVLSRRRARLMSSRPITVANVCNRNESSDHWKDGPHGTSPRGFVDWWKQGGPERRFAIRSLRVLVIVPNERWLDTLRTAAIEATDDEKGSGFVWLATEADVSVASPERFLGDSWRVARAGDDEKRALIPAIGADECGDTSVSQDRAA